MKLLTALFLLILLSCAFLLNTEGEGAELPTNSKNQKTQSDKYGGATNTLPQHPSAPMVIFDNQAAEKEQTRPEAKSDKWPPTPLEVGAFIIAFGAVLVAWRTLDAVKRQAIAAERTLTSIERQVIANEVSADAARDAAHASIESNKQARNVAHAELRAYVLITDVKLAGSDRFDWKTHATYLIGEQLVITFRNSGRTPAYNLTAWVNWRLMDGLDTRLPEDFSYPKPQEIEPTLNSRFTLSPDRDQPITSDIDPDDVEIARKRFNTLYFFGEATYTDVFNHEQITLFCFSFYISPSGEREEFITYDQHNDPT